MEGRLFNAQLVDHVEREDDDADAVEDADAERSEVAHEVSVAQVQPLRALRPE